jgi:Replication-relaxation
MCGRDPLLPVLRQLTSRDRQLLGVLYDHKIFTTEQLATALFPNLDTAQHRLVVLYRLGVVDRFRWFREGGGSYSWRYTLGQLGAEYVAALRAEDPPRRDQLTKRNRRLAVSPTIEHTLGVNGFFTDLLGHARTHPRTALRRWWSPEQCNRPSAFGPLLPGCVPTGTASGSTGTGCCCSSWSTTPVRSPSGVWSTSSTTTPAPRSGRSRTYLCCSGCTRRPANTTSTAGSRRCASPC